MTTAPRDLGELARLPGYELLSSLGFVDVIEALGKTQPEAAEALLDGVVKLMQVPSAAPRDKKLKALKALNFNYLQRLWASRPPALSPELAQRLSGAMGHLVAFLGGVVEELRPKPIALGRLASVRVNLLRRRLESAPAPLRAELFSALARGDHAATFEDWTRDTGYFGMPTTSRPVVEKLAQVIADAEELGEAPRRARQEAIAAKLERPSEPLRAAQALLATMSPAPAPLEELRRATVSLFDERGSRFAIKCVHALSCLESSTCNQVVIDLEEPLAPFFMCDARGRPCTLKRMAAETLVEALAGVKPEAGDFEIEGLDAMLAHCESSASARMISRLDRLDLSLAKSQSTTEDGTIAWVLSPFSALELSLITSKKKGGQKSKKLTAADAERALKTPGQHVAAAILKSQRMFQDRRGAPAADPVDALAPALAALGPDERVYLSFEGELRPLKVEVHEPRITAERDAEGRVRFQLMLGDVPLDPKDRVSRAWATRLDLARGRLLIGPVNESLRSAATTLITLPPTPIEEDASERFAESMLRLEKRVPVKTDASWLGHRHAPEATWILQLEWAGKIGTESGPRAPRALEARLRVKVVPELGAFVPGEGERILPIRRAGPDGQVHLGHVERDPESETRAALDVIHALGLEWPGTAGLFDWRFLALDEVWSVITTAQALTKEGALELHWASKPLTFERANSAERLQLRLGYRRDWLDVKGGYQLDGGELPLAELLKALAEGKRFVAVDETRFVELTAELRKALAPLTSMAREVGGKIVASPLAAPLVDELTAVGVDFDAPQEWLAMTERMQEASRLEPAPPSSLANTLRPYQLDGYRWITRLAHWAKGACLADDMGLGKTLQALTFIVSRAERGATLVIAPTSVVPNWQREATRFAPGLRVRRALQGVALEPALAELGPGDVLVTSWDLLVRHERLQGGPRGSEPGAPPWATVVLDEAHAMKNPTTRRAQAARALRADFILALTGTPVENRPYELWSLMSVVAPGLLGSAETFREQFGRDIEARTPEASARLARIVRPFMLRRSKSQVAADLPAKSEVRVDVMLSGDERDRYQRVRMAAIRELDQLGPEAVDGQKGIIRVLAVLTRLRQIACHPRLVDPKAPATSSKLERLLELAEELRGEGRKMLVFSQFTELLKLVAEAFTQHELSFAYLDGSTPGEERVAAVDRFQSGAVDAFLLSLKAGGVGLNLTTATEVVHLDPWWNPAVEDQASDRAHRIGQDKPVTVYRMVANGTIEEQILGMHADKRLMASALLEGTSSAKPVTADEMMALLMGDTTEAADLEPSEPAELQLELYVAPSSDAAEVALVSEDSVGEAAPDLAEAGALASDVSEGVAGAPAVARSAGGAESRVEVDAPKVSTAPTSKRRPKEGPRTTESDSHNAGDDAGPHAAQVSAVVALMEREPERRLRRSTLQESLGLDDAGWASLRQKLAADPRILVEGERRGTTYRLRAATST